MAGNALRVLGFACRTVSADTCEDLETHLTWLGLIGLADPPRDSIEALIAQFHKAGIRTVMITGDQQISALGRGSPLNVMQLLWINMISDILPGLALSLEKPEGDVLERQPRNATDPLFSNKDFCTMLMESSTITGGALGTMLYGLSRYGSAATAGGLAFQSLAFGQLLHSFTCRSETAGIFTRKKLPANNPLNWAIGLSIGAQVLTMAVPPLRSLLGLSRISLMGWPCDFSRVHHTPAGQ